MKPMLNSRSAQALIMPLFVMAEKCGYHNRAVSCLHLPAGGTEIKMTVNKPGEEKIHEFKVNYDSELSMPKISRFLEENGAFDEKIFREMLGEDMACFEPAPNSGFISETRLKNKIEQTTAPRVTKEQIEGRIKKITCSVLEFAPTVTICQITLDNGFSVRGESACVNPENYDREIGEKIAYDNAFRQLWAFFGFMLAEDQHRDGQVKSFNDTVAEIAEEAADEALAEMAGEKNS